MECRNTVGDLRCREVINICDGCRLGFVNDVQINLSNGCVCALLVPGKAKWFGMFGRSGDWVIPWNCIRNIGDDIILVEVSCPEFCDCKRGWNPKKQP